MTSPNRTPWERWREVGERVFVRRHQRLDVNAGLVLGDESALVIDTRGSEREGRELLRAIRAITPLPLVLVNTHAHFDHCFGNSVFAAAQPELEIWAQVRCLDELRRSGTDHRASIAGWLRESGEVQLAGEVEQVDLTLPNRTLDGEVRLDLGGREVRLAHLGRGHTDHDVVVEVADVTFAGDLVEQGAPPSFDDAFPQEWTQTLDRLLERAGPVVVPGHGDVVDLSFVTRQRADIAEVAQVAARLPTAASDQELEWAANRLAVGGPAGYLALRRAHAQLAELTTGEHTKSELRTSKHTTSEHTTGELTTTAPPG